MIRIKYIPVVLSAFTTLTLTAQEISDAYTFIIKPGSKEWNQLKTHEDMIRVCQIPEDTLTKLTTKALLETCLAYPLMPDAFVYNNMKEGFNKTYDKFNAYNELISRKDFASQLIKAYEMLNFKLLDSMQSDEEKGFFVIKISVAELFFGTSEFISQLHIINNKEILSILIDKLIDKVQFHNIFGQIGIVSSSYAMINVLAVASDNELLKSDEMNDFKTYMEFKNVEILDKIILMAKKYIE